MADYYNLDFWRGKGFRDDQIFDPETGQLREGWSRTGMGYENPSYSYLLEPTVPENAPYESSGQGGQGGGNIASPNFKWPQFNPQTFTPLDFSYEPFGGFDKFAAPTPDEIQSEPGYAFARDEGLRAAENSAAARGTLRTGGTIKDLIGWGNRFADQNASKVYDRKMNLWGKENENKYTTWTGNRDLAWGSYDRNERAREAAFGLNYQGARDAFQFNEFEPAKLTFADMFNRWKAQGDWLSQPTE